MKIEIDTNNLPAMERLEAELSIALGSVRHAIEGYKQRSVIRAQQPPAAQAKRADEDKWVPRAAAEALKDALGTLPEEFSSSQFFEFAKSNHPNVGKISLRLALQRAADAGTVEQIEASSGRKPARYRKAGIGK